MELTYVYGYDGKLFAEYDGLGNCIRDYIYVGSRLFAEYRVQENRLYYYCSDQINSTRMITDETGTVIYSAAHDPYGGIQKSWVSTYDPALKFSGKERDSESGLDYFGARYFYMGHYRWLSVDPVINREEALANPQLWNLYAYCRNNPATFWDPDGMDTINIFMGFGENDRGRSSTGSHVDFPDFGSLADAAKEKGHTINIKKYSSAEFMESLQSEDTWTFAVGHSFADKATGNALGLRFNDGVFASPVNSPNRFVGVFACNSFNFVFSLISGPIAFGVDSGADRSSAHGLAMGAEYLIRLLVQNYPPEAAAAYATKAMRYSWIRADQNDKIVHR